VQVLGFCGRTNSPERRSNVEQASARPKCSRGRASAPCHCCGEHPKTSNGFVAECCRRDSPSCRHSHLTRPRNARRPTPRGRSRLRRHRSVQKVTTRKPTPCAPGRDEEKLQFRLDTPERAYVAGVRRLGISHLYGLYAGATRPSA
jgi:hypothetical protein